MIKTSSYNLYLYNKFIIFSFIIMATLGTMMRLQFTGIDFGFLNLRHAHSHLGFYGVFVPMTWVLSPHFNKLFNFRYELYFYYLFVWVAFFAFLFGGYNLIAHIFSAIIYIFWVYKYPKININSFTSKTLIYLNLTFITLSLLAVIFGPKLLSHLLVADLAHGFILNIIFLVILVPIIGEYIYPFKLSPLWLIGTILFYLTEIKLFQIHFNIGELILGLFLIFTPINKKINSDFELYFSILIKSMAIVFVISSLLFSLLKYNYNIATIHALFLSIIGPHYISKILSHHFNKLIFFVISFLGLLMSAIIVLLDYFPEWFIQINFLIAFLGGLIVLALIGTYFLLPKKQ